MNKLNKNFPFVSIIVPVYNGEECICKCIESLLNQDYSKDSYEIIVVDNNSNDNTANIIKKYPVKYVLEDKVQSSYAARNSGIKISAGSILAFTDADCVADSAWLKNLIEAWGNGCWAMAGEICEMLSKSFVEKFQEGTFNQENQLLFARHPFAATANVAYKKELFGKIGYFNENLVSGGDADFSWRLQNAGFKINFLAKAKITHKNRRTIVGLYKQSKRYAFGGVCLSLEYKHAHKKRVHFLIKLFKKILWEISLLPYRLLTVSFKNDKAYYLIEPFLMIIKTCGYIHGELLGLKFIKGNKVKCPNE